MAPAELGARRPVGDRLPDQLAGIRVGLQQADHVARDLPRVVVLDAAAEAGQQLRTQRRRIGPVDRHPNRSVVGHVDVVHPHGFLTLHAHTVGHPELPVVPRARDEVAVELALREAVALVRTRVIDGVQAISRANQTHPMAVDLDHLHRADRQVVDRQAGSGEEVCVHGDTT